MGWPTKEAGRAYNKEYHRLHPLPPGRQWANHLLYQYKLTPAQYDEMVKAQDDRCAICGASETRNRSGKPMRLSLDHDHACCPTARSCGRCVRLLLCHSCNQGLGVFGDSPFLLRLAAEYLESFR